MKAAAAGSANRLDPQKPSEDMNFELVHCVGKVRNDQILMDDDFKIHCKDSYRMWRSVEMYQWYENQRIEEKEHEHEDEYGMKTWSVTRNVHYEYNKGWHPRPINSRNF